jgi:hypothetical protein
MGIEGDVSAANRKFGRKTKSGLKKIIQNLPNFPASVKRSPSIPIHPHHFFRADFRLSPCPAPREGVKTRRAGRDLTGR